MAPVVSRTILIGAPGAGKAAVLNALLQSDVFQPHRLSPASSAYVNPSTSLEYISLSVAAPTTPEAAAAVLQAIAASLTPSSSSSSSPPTALVLVCASRGRANAATLARLLHAATRHAPAILATRASDALRAAAAGRGGQPRLAALLGLPDPSVRIAAVGRNPDQHELTRFFSALTPLPGAARKRLAEAAQKPAKLPTRRGTLRTTGPLTLTQSIRWHTTYETVLLAGGGAAVRAVRGALLGRRTAAASTGAASGHRLTLSPNGRIVVLDVSDDDGLPDTNYDDDDGGTEGGAGGALGMLKRLRAQARKSRKQRQPDVAATRRAISHVLRRALGPVRVVLCVALRRGWICSADLLAASALRAELRRHGMAPRKCVRVVGVGGASDVAFISAANSDGRVWDHTLADVLFGERRGGGPLSELASVAVGAGDEGQEDKKKEKGKKEDAKTDKEDEDKGSASSKKEKKNKAQEGEKGDADDGTMKSMMLRHEEANAIIVGSSAGIAAGAVTKRLREFVNNTPAASVGDATDGVEEEDDALESDSDDSSEGSKSSSSSEEGEDEEGENGSESTGSGELGMSDVDEALAGAGATKLVAEETGLDEAIEDALHGGPNGSAWSGYAGSSGAWSSGEWSMWSGEAQPRLRPWESGDLFLCDAWPVR